MQKNKSEQVESQNSSELPVDVFIQGQNLDQGSKSSIISVERKTFLKKKQEVDIEIKERTDDRVYATNDGYHAQDLDEQGYITKDELESAVQSEYYKTDTVADRRFINNLGNENLKNSGEVLVFSRDLDGSKARFYKCDVIHKVIVEMTDPWKDTRYLASEFDSRQSAQSFARDIRGLKNKDSHLYREGNYLRVEGEPIQNEKNMSDHVVFDGVAKSFVMGTLVGLFLGILGFGLLLTILCVGTISLLDHARAFWKSRHTSQTEKFYLHGFDESMSEHGFEMSELEDMEVTEKFNDEISIEIDDNIRLKSEDIDACWTLETVKNSNLPSEDSSDFIDKLGIEKISEDSFRAKVEKRVEEPEEYCIESDCGEWYLYPEVDY